MSYKDTIKKELLEMWQLVLSQLMKSCQSIQNFDQDLAREVVLIEERVECCQILMDKDCEVLMTLSKDQAGDLPFIMAVIKANRNLERIGEIAADIAKEIIQSPLPYSKKLMQETKILAAYDIAIKMLDIARMSFEKEDVELAQLVIRRSKYLENFNDSIHINIRQGLIKNPAEVKSGVPVLSILTHLSRLAELANSLAVEIIGYYQLKAGKMVSA